MSRRPRSSFRPKGSVSTICSSGSRRPTMPRRSRPRSRTRTSAAGPTCRSSTRRLWNAGSKRCEGTLALLVTDSETGEILGSGNLHQINRELGQVEIGYWLFPEARGRGVATRTARFLAEHAFSIGFERVEARVFAGNPESERVLVRAGFRREGVLRSLPKRAGGRDDMTLYSLLPGE